MSTQCTSTIEGGGKGNAGHFINRIPGVIAAGLPTKQPSENAQNNIEHYLLKDEVDALINDTIIPRPKAPTKLPPLRRPRSPDKRHINPTQVAALLQSAPLSRFQTITEELKNTVYASYWNKPLASSKDPVPMLPVGFDLKNTTFGENKTKDESLYEVIFPKRPVYEDSVDRRPGMQKRYNYCSPPFDQNHIFGHKYKFDVKNTPFMKDCLTDNKAKTGNSTSVIMSAAQANAKVTTQAQKGLVLAPIENFRNLPEGHTYGIKTKENNLDCFTGSYVCRFNPQKVFYQKCIAYLNSLRRLLKKQHLPELFKQLYREIKFFDKDHNGWIEKKMVYICLGNKSIRVDPTLIEPLLELWNAYDGNCIDYKKFVDIINFTIHLPSLPKIEDFPKDCLRFETTYSEMMKPGQCADPRPMAGTPSGRFIDTDYPITPENYCKAFKTCLPQESDVRSCLNPSTMTRYFVSHRDMFAKREPEVVKNVFEAAGETFTDEEFEQIWQEAQKKHSEGWVCFETFRIALKVKKGW